MPASIVDFLADGLVIEFDGTRMSATVPIHVKDLTTASGDPLDLLAEAMNAAGMPTPGSGRNILGRDVYAQRYRIGAWANADAEVLVTFVENVTSLGGTNVVVEGGSTLEQSETDFESAERKKPWAERTPMSVFWDASSDGEPNLAIAEEQSVRLPYFAGKPYRRYTMTLGDDPGPLAEKFVGAVNESVWKGYPVESVLCIGITFRNAGQGFSTTFEFSIDRDTRHRAIGRARDRTTGEFIAVTNVQLANYNGAKDFIVQNVEDFSALPI